MQKILRTLLTIIFKKGRREVQFVLLFIKKMGIIIINMLIILSFFFGKYIGKKEFELTLKKIIDNYI